jgi:cytochrome c biogenesis protein CcmG, thiol:disulfide interchange protein DsbE
VGALALLAVVVAVPGGSPSDDRRPAPGFSLPDLRDPGRTIDLASYRGTPVVVNLFASWCEPCKRELPLLARVSAERAPGVQFLGVAHVDDDASSLALLDEYGVDYPAAADHDGVVGERYRLVGLPSTLFIDADGGLVGTLRGELTERDLTSWLARFDSDATGSPGRSGPPTGARPLDRQETAQ